MNNDDTAGDLAGIIFNALSSDLPVTFEYFLPGQFVYTTCLDGFSIGAGFDGVTGEYFAWYSSGSKSDYTEFLAAAIFHKLVDMHGRENLPVELYEALYLPMTGTVTKP